MKDTTRKFEDPEVQAAYDETLKDKQVELARRQAVADAEKEANKKTGFAKVVGALGAVGKGVANFANSVELPEVDPFTGVRLREPTSKKEKKR